MIEELFGILKASADEIAPVTANVADNIVANANDMGSTANGIASFLPLILIFVIFYFLMLRPQIKQQKEHKALLNGLKKGDKVITSGGILATIVKVEDDNMYVQAEIAQNVKVRMLKTTVTALHNPDLNKDKKIEKSEDKLEAKEEVITENNDK
jgi:preprotein translocase subunit YajC